MSDYPQSWPKMSPLQWLYGITVIVALYFLVMWLSPDKPSYEDVHGRDDCVVRTYDIEGAMTTACVNP